MALTLAFPATGNPHPEEPFPGVGAFDGRSRVTKNPARTLSDWSWVFDCIRCQVGMHEGSCGLRERVVEVQCALLRRRIEEHEERLPDCLKKNGLGLLRHMFEQFTKCRCDHEMVKVHSAKPKFEAAVRAFAAQDVYPNLFEYLIGSTYERAFAINMEFLREAGDDPAALFQDDRMRAPEAFQRRYGHRGWAALSGKEKEPLLVCYVRRRVARMHGLRRADWTPSGVFAVLRAQLRERGPIAISGALGKPYYLEEPEAIPGILLEGRTVHGWPRGSLRVDNRLAPHTILIVGAEVRGESELVYFIDPLDKSDPKDAGKQKVYCMSYGNIKRHCVDLRGFSSQEAGDDSPFKYAHTGPLPQLPVRAIRLPRLGKPHPLAPYRGVGVPDERGRVIQKGQDNGTCWYYVLNGIRQRIGKNLEAQDTLERRIEKIVSNGRKRLSRIDDGLQAHLAYVDSKRELFEGIRRFNFEEYRGHGAFSQAHWQEMLTAFAGQTKYQTFYTFLKAVPKENEMQVYLEILAQLGRDPALMLREAQRKDGLIARITNNASFEDLPYSVKNWTTHFFTIQAASEAYNLRVSSWSPHHRFDELIREIGAHGPLAIAGDHGPVFYAALPSRIGRRIEGRDVYGWRPGTPRIDQNFSHMILVVGAEKIEGQQLVYFVDPNHESDPEAPEKQKIYCISYRNLCQHASDRMGRKFAEHPERKSPFGWAYTGYSREGLL